MQFHLRLGVGIGNFVSQSLLISHPLIFFFLAICFGFVVELYL